MCGFVAVLSPNGVVSEDVLHSMCNNIKHRGPDNMSYWRKEYSNRGIAFGFCRLSIIDLRNVANQPFISNDGKKVMVFNGEIYNYQDLKKQLQSKGFYFRTESDTEVLISAYECWGADFIQHLNGMFACIIWDELEKQIIIARDRFGEKPLFYTKLHGGGYAFSSEIKGLSPHPDINLSINYKSLSANLFGDINFGKEKTLFDCVFQFKSSHIMVISQDFNIKQYKKYWTPNYSDNPDKLNHYQITEQFKKILDASTTARMRADVPLIACLSGGLDSSSLCALMSRKGLEYTISARFPNDKTIDEGEYIDAVLDYTSLKNISVSPNETDLLADLRSLHWHHETVIPGLSMYLEWCVMRTAKERGFKVIIDGQGADEILAGYQIYFQAYLFDLWKKGKKISAFLNGFMRDARLRMLARRYKDYRRRFSNSDSLTYNEYLKFENSHLKEMSVNYGKEEYQYANFQSSLRYELVINLMKTSLPSNLHSGDRNSMAHGIECRYPFLDYNLVDFALTLPDFAYFKNAWSKRVLRDSFQNYLPKKVIWRVDKVGFAAPQDNWLKHEKLKAWVKERIHSERLKTIDGYENIDLIEKWNRHDANSADHSELLWRWASASELLEMQRTGAWVNA